MVEPEPEGQVRCPRCVTLPRLTPKWKKSRKRKVSHTFRSKATHAYLQSCHLHPSPRTRQHNQPHWHCSFPALSYDAPTSIHASVVHEAHWPRCPCGQFSPLALHILALGRVAAYRPRKRQGTEKCVKEDPDPHSAGWKVVHSSLSLRCCTYLVEFEPQG